MLPIQFENFINFGSPMRKLLMGKVLNIMRE